MLKKYRIVVSFLLFLLLNIANTSYATFCQKPFELSTQENRIVDQCGNDFKLKSVNWSGAQVESEVPGGLNKQPLKNIVNLIKTGGFNSVRLAFSNHMLHNTQLVNQKYIAANPELATKTPLQVFDVVIKALTDAGIVVILNNTTTTSEWCCGYDFNGLWHNPNLQTPLEWVNDWAMLAGRYANNPLVAGFDLRNEVRTMRFYNTILPVYPNWGKGDINDWKLAATHAGNIVLNINSRLLIIVEGINWYGIPQIDGYRPLLMPVKNNPMSLDQHNKLVYEAHVYGYTGPKHTGDDKTSYGQIHYGDMDEATLKATLDEEISFVLEKGHDYTAPVWLGELGVGANAIERDKQWFAKMVNYVIENNLSWGFWALNPEKADGSNDDFGLLNNDWSGYRDDWRNEYLQKLLK